jgi:hypothetical protein
VTDPDDAARAAADALGRRVVGQPQLVWRPCRESAGPLQPLYRVVTEGGEAFVSAAGIVHRTLTPFGRGG